MAGNDKAIENAKRAEHIHIETSSMRCKIGTRAHTTVAWGKHIEKCIILGKIQTKTATQTALVNLPVTSADSMWWFCGPGIFHADRPAEKHQLSTKRGLHCYIWFHPIVIQEHIYCTYIVMVSLKFFKKSWHVTLVLWKLRTQTKSVCGQELPMV